MTLYKIAVSSLIVTLCGGRRASTLYLSSDVASPHPFSAVPLALHHPLPSLQLPHWSKIPCLFMMGLRMWSVSLSQKLLPPLSPRCVWTSPVPCMLTPWLFSSDPSSRQQKKRLLKRNLMLSTARRRDFSLEKARRVEV